MQDVPTRKEKKKVSISLHSTGGKKISPGFPLPYLLIRVSQNLWANDVGHFHGVSREHCQQLYECRMSKEQISFALRVDE